MQKEEKRNIKENMLRARGRLWEPEEEMQRGEMESGEGTDVVVKGSKRVKKPGAR